ncbi:FecR domain-containing protein [Chitinophaga varians]|uniref:FecR domain-containing protein n=1 Tax=Chitinophaga varians TaxID=2202339 RepID=UPI00165EE48D|nr:FecR domain-containing protein [Chitinophaga varians]MBC9914291.1 DUF4974 domain-containing protein [Chitinophaga varians]
MKDNIHQLIEKYLDGSITPAEEAILMAWYQEHNQTDIEWLSENEDEEEQVRQRMLTRLSRQINIPEVPPARNRRWMYLSAAASVLLLLGFAGYYYFMQLGPPAQPANAALALTDIRPGGNKAILTLDNGDKLVLEEAKSGVISHQGNTSVNKTDSGQLSYQVTDNGASAVVYNTLTTPYGGQYQITLQDGTKVWLNAGSSLRFPVSFSGNERNVALTGEAYFEVAKDKSRPFLVTTSTGSATPMTVRVLGTHFNINAYPDEQQNTVTLLEGAVKVDYGPSNALLAPGREVTLNKTTGKLLTAGADTESATAWKNGYFIFDNEKIESIMRQISRWYDVEISYQGDVSRKAIGGSLSRSKNVSEVLNMLELTGTVHFKTNGRRITVMP